jgi:hypothetical protein
VRGFSRDAEDCWPMTKTFQLLIVLLVGSILIVGVVDVGVDLLTRQF